MVKTDIVKVENWKALEEIDNEIRKLLVEISETAIVKLTNEICDLKLWINNEYLIEDQKDPNGYIALLKRNIEERHRKITLLKKSINWLSNKEVYSFSEIKEDDRNWQVQP